MRVGDLEFMARVQLAAGAADTSTFATINFALGIRTRPLLTKVQVFPFGATAVTSAQGVFLENGAAIAAGQSLAALRTDARLSPIWSQDSALSTNGMGLTFPFQTDWSTILQPDVRIHEAQTVAATGIYVVLLHYRFAELTPDEIVEIAAQRGVN